MAPMLAGYRSVENVENCSRRLFTEEQVGARYRYVYFL